MGLLDSSGGGRRLTGSLGGQLLPGKWRDKVEKEAKILEFLPGRLAAGGLAGGLLGASHGSW